MVVVGGLGLVGGGAVMLGYRMLGVRAALSERTSVSPPDPLAGTAT